MTKLIISSFAALLLAAGPFALKAQEDPVRQAGRRVVALTSLASKEYAVGVVGGRVVLEAEVEEARLFLMEAEYAIPVLPEAARPRATALIARMLGIVAAIGEPNDLISLADSVEAELSTHISGLGETLPETRPDPVLGAAVYSQACADCHGVLGMGDGIRAGEMDPVPSDLTDREGLSDQSPLDFYRKVLLGISGTEMPSHEEALTADEIWAVAWYASELRLDRRSVEDGRALLARSGGGEVPLQVRSQLFDPGFVSTQSDAGLQQTALNDLEGVNEAQAGAVAAFARTLPELIPTEGNPAWAATELRLVRAVREGLVGNHEEAAQHVFDAYVAFEGVERELSVRDGALAAELEFGFAELRSRAKAGDADLYHGYVNLSALVSRAESTVSPPVSTGGLAVQSFVLLFREGVEALLIIGALATLLVKAGAGERRKEIRTGVVAALVASVLTAVLFETIFRIGVVQQELLEGLTMLSAAVVLLFVSYWLISKIEINRWKAFVASQGNRALKSGSRFALMGAAFLAVYREGFETILFYKALFITAGGTGTGAVIGGAAAAVAALGLLYYAITQFGYRLPIRPFFAVTSGVLLYMAFAFVGKGIAELQGSALIPTTVLDWAPRIPWMGIYPTTQTLIWQMAILALVGVGLLWTFLLQPILARARS